MSEINLRNQSYIIPYVIFLGMPFTIYVEEFNTTISYCNLVYVDTKEAFYKYYKGGLSAFDLA